MEETTNQAQEQRKKSKVPATATVGVLLLLAAGAAYFSTAHTHTTSLPKHVVAGARVTPAVTQQASGSAVPSGVKLADSPDAKNAFLIFPGDLSADAKNALTGFAMQTKQLPNGVMQVTLVAKKQEYTTQTLTVQKGQSVYFIEKFGMDDNTNEDTDNGMRDDKAIIVDSNGYIVQQ